MQSQTETKPCHKCAAVIPAESAYCLHCGAKQKAEKAKKQYEYQRVFFTHNGKQYGTYGKTLREAHAKSAKKEAAIKQNDLLISGGNMTMAQWADEWLETYKRKSIGESQYNSYRYHINVINAAIGTKKLQDITDTDLQKILNAREGKSKSDITKLHMTIRSIIKRARLSRMIRHDPAEELMLPQTTEKKRRPLTSLERQKILELSEKHYAGIWIKIMLYCGLRPGECRALDWRHVNLETKSISVEHAMKARTKAIGEPKSKAGIRIVPIPDALYATLQASQKEPHEPVIVKPISKKRHDEKSMRTMWLNFKRELDILMGATLKQNKIIKSVVAPDLVPYNLRHTYGTDLQTAGVPINVAKYLMGHSNITMTANVYTHIMDEAINEALKRINERNENVK